MHQIDLFKSEHRKPIAITLATIVLGLGVITAIIFVWTGERPSLINRMSRLCI